MAKYQFSPSFRFGVADADLQVVGEDYPRKEEGSCQTMWDYFAKTTGKTPPGQGVDRYHMWRKDIELMKSLGVKHYRTSISMARILKENGEINTKAVAWYANYFKALKKEGIAIYATLYHWELPEYLHAIGGLTNKKFVDVFVKHAAAVAKTLGEYIDEYFILNEPWCSSFLSYHLGIHAPGEKNLNHAIVAAHNLLLAQGLAFRAIKNIDKSAEISTVVNVEASYPYSQNGKDKEAAFTADGYQNRWFMDPLYFGKYPEDMVSLFGRDMPRIPASDMKILAIGKELHALGINNYCGRIIKYDPTSRLKYTAINRPGGPVNDLGWPIFVPPVYPEALYDILTEIYFSYRNYGLKRMYITENGMALEAKVTPTMTVVPDTRRVEYLANHIGQVYKAMERGVPVEAYFAWTLMDNFEWAEGYRPKSCFGMVYVDRKTMKRIPKKSVLWYSRLMKTHELL